MQQASSHNECSFLVQVQCMSSFLSTWFWSVRKNYPNCAPKTKSLHIKVKYLLLARQRPSYKKISSLLSLQPNSGGFEEKAASPCAFSAFGTPLGTYLLGVHGPLRAWWGPCNWPYAYLFTSQVNGLLGSCCTSLAGLKWQVLFVLLCEE